MKWLWHRLGLRAVPIIRSINRGADLPAGAAGWETAAPRGYGQGMLDGLSVWGREILRPVGERSMTAINAEAERARRVADLWGVVSRHPSMKGSLDLAQYALASALGLGGTKCGFCLAAKTSKPVRLV